MADHPGMRMLVGMSLLWSSLLFTGAGVAAPAAAPAPAVWSTPAAAAGARAQGLYSTAEGREFSVGALSATGAVTDRILLGARWYTVGGHGRNAANRYDAHGWDVGLSYTLPPAPGSRTAWQAGITVSHEDGHLEVPGGPLVADPTYQSLVLHLAAERPAGPTTWQAFADYAPVSLYGTPQATVLAGGVAMQTPLSPSTRGSAGLTLAQDDLGGGRHVTLQLDAVLTLAASDRAALTLGGSYFPQGVPVAGSPLSPGSLVGAYFGGDSATNFRVRAIGYLTLAGSARW